MAAAPLCVSSPLAPCCPIVAARKREEPCRAIGIMMLSEEKKDCCSPPPPPIGATPNPLAMAPPLAPAAAASSSAVPMPINIQFSQQKPRNHPPQAQAAAPVLGITSSGVPNPIMMNSSSGPTVPYGHTTPVTVTQTFPDTHAHAMGGGTSSLVPSPLASPILETPILLTTNPPSRPQSACTVGTSASTMDAMASAMDGNSLVEENFEPPTARRRRANTIQWATSQTNAETLQPVNFGDQQQQQQQVHFSPGAGTGASSRKLSHASSSCGSSLGPRTASSGSLYSEYSCDSGSAAGTASSPVLASSVSTGALTTTTTAHIASSGGILAPGTASRTTTAGFRRPATVNKRQKRLERNRESARASRRRRKQYLEELELKVSHLSREMDRGRMNHACVAVRTVRGMRLGKLREAERTLLVGADGNNRGGVGTGPVAGGVATAVSHGIKPMPATVVKSGIQHNVRTSLSAGAMMHRSPIPNPAASLDRQTAPLTGQLSRAADELTLVQTFMKQQLLSLVQPTSTKFMLWLSLQKDGFYRGGRSASERLSAARIGERLLHSGTDRAAPNSGMWPLACHEIGLSYDQEEKIRHTQRGVLANSESWIQRHTALGTKNVIESIHNSIGGAQQAAKRRENSLISILNQEQRVKFLAWASRRSEAIRKLGESRLKPPVAARAYGKTGGNNGDEYVTSPDRHIAANLYIIDHQLSKVIQRSHIPNFVHPSKLKKLSRRPSFESLAGYQNESETNSKISRETSFPSTGSLKRGLNDVVGGDNFNEPSGMMTHSSSQNSITPESAQTAGQAAVMSILKDIIPIIPKSALLYSQNPHYNTASVYPPQSVISQPARVVMPLSQPQLSQPHFRSTPNPTAQTRRSTLPHNYTAQHTQIQSTTPAVAAAAMTVPSPQIPEVDDIPMPTPVSVLLHTTDDFISQAVPYQQQQEPLDAMTSSAPEPDYGIPELVPSSYATDTTTTAIATGPLLSSRHQSAPDFSYPSLLPTPMAMIPESSLLTNTPMMQGGVDDIADYALEDLPEMGADDWDIGEGFDMDVDLHQGTA